MNVDLSLAMDLALEVNRDCDSDKGSWSMDVCRHLVARALGHAHWPALMAAADTDGVVGTIASKTGLRQRCRENLRASAGPDQVPAAAVRWRPIGAKTLTDRGYRRRVVGELRHHIEEYGQAAPLRLLVPVHGSHSHGTARALLKSWMGQNDCAVIVDESLFEFDQAHGGQGQRLMSIALGHGYRSLASVADRLLAADPAVILFDTADREVGAISLTAARMGHRVIVAAGPEVLDRIHHSGGPEVQDIHVDLSGGRVIPLPAVALTPEPEAGA